MIRLILDWFMPRFVLTRTTLARKREEAGERGRRREADLRLARSRLERASGIDRRLLEHEIAQLEVEVAVINRELEALSENRVRDSLMTGIEAETAAIRTAVRTTTQIDETTIDYEQAMEEREATGAAIADALRISRTRLPAADPLPEAAPVPVTQPTRASTRTAGPLRVVGIED